MKIEFRDGLLFASIELTYKGKTKTIDNIVIDTGASKTLISQDVVDELGIRYSLDDEVVTSYGIGGKEFAFAKEVDSVKIGEYSSDACSIDFTGIDYDDINGLLGLDLLIELGAVIDLKKLEIYV